MFYRLVSHQLLAFTHVYVLVPHQSLVHAHARWDSTSLSCLQRRQGLVEVAIGFARVSIVIAAGVPRHPRQSHGRRACA
jgi:hypothetical protein